MEVNVNNLGIRHEILNAGATGASGGPADAPRSSGVKANLKITSRTADGVSSMEPTATIPDAALSRDDDIGKLVKSAFNLPPPPMPNFTD
jgi:hypothetical protein